MTFATLRYLRAVASTWSEIVGRPNNFGVAAALMGQPDRYDIASDRPDLGEREARKLARSRKPQPAPRPSGAPDAIGAEYATLRHYRAVAEAWPNPVVRTTSFNTADALRAQPDREDIATANPDLSYREARKLAR